MVVNARSVTPIMKRRVTADLPDIHTFPSSSTSSSSIRAAPFRVRVIEFLRKHAASPPPSSLSPKLMCLQVLLRIGEAEDQVVVGLDVVEEEVARSSRSVYCDQCRVVGWSGHPVCAKRYHIIIKSDEVSIGGSIKPCIKCGNEVHLSEPRCKSCNHVMTAEDVEDWVYAQLDDTSHLLHGVIHSNGYGHLLRVNGREGGSKVLSGFHIMDFWDRLCRYLGVRKVSVMDVSKKFGLEYRLLHAIARGHPWYGDWGYDFGTGSFGLTLETYKASVEMLSKMPLSMFICQGRKPRTRVQDLILFYQSLSEHELVNVRDLFSFMMSLVHDAPKVSASADGISKKRKVSSGTLCAWTNGDIKRVEDAMFRVLRAVSGSGWVSWRTLRGAVCKVGPPELLDYCLKDLAGKQAGNGLLVQVRCHPGSGALEYRLEPAASLLLENSSSSAPPISNCPMREHLIADMRLLYESLLHPQTMIAFGPEARRDLALSAATKLLDCKQFVKDYNPDASFLDAELPSTFLFCQLVLLDHSEEYSTNPPPELIVLSPNATIKDLKAEASKAFQEVYLVFKGFQVDELLDYGVADETTPVKLLIRSPGTVFVRGKWTMRNGLGRFRMERGLERWTVDCPCGAVDDDGERMLACDACGIWQHTRCAGIPDFDTVPARFVCYGCRVSGKVPKTSGDSTHGIMTSDVAVHIGRSKGGGSSNGVGGGSCRVGGKILAEQLDVR
ncbi:PHD finger protein-like protein [Drosera capensis]